MRSRLLALVLLAVAPALVHCGTTEDGESPSDDALTDIPLGRVKMQAVGNCWLYAMTGWAEALAQRAAPEEDYRFSEGYLSYWHWYQQITGRSFVQDLFDSDPEIEAGGYWDRGLELVHRYGMFDVRPPRAPAARITPLFGRDPFASIKRALERTNAALQSGVLSTRAAREDGALVRRALDDAFELDAETRAQLTNVFGEAGTRDFMSGARAATGTKILEPRDIPTWTVSAGEGRVGKLEELVDASSGHAWRRASYPVFVGRRDFQKRIQRALHDGLPVPIEWVVVGGTNMDRGEYKPLSEGVEVDLFRNAFGHASLIFDYQVSNVPGHGTLAAGAPVTDRRALSAALDDAATIDFFRVRNSWGFADGTTLGNNDLFMGYLDTRWTYRLRPRSLLLGVALPPGY